jgi:hypothetical protein
MTDVNILIQNPERDWDTVFHSGRINTVEERIDQILNWINLS